MGEGAQGEEGEQGAQGERGEDGELGDHPPPCTPHPVSFGRRRHIAW